MEDPRNQMKREREQYICSYATLGLSLLTAANKQPHNETENAVLRMGIHRVHNMDILHSSRTNKLSEASAFRETGIREHTNEATTAAGLER